MIIIHKYSIVKKYKIDKFQTIKQCLTQSFENSSFPDRTRDMQTVAINSFLVTVPRGKH